MSNKLKRKASSRAKLPFANRQIQHMAMEFHATKDQLKRMEEEIWRDAWDEAEEWSNIVNTVTVMKYLHDKKHWKAETLLKIVKGANEYVQMANRGEKTILSMMQELQDIGFGFDEKHWELVRKIGL